MTNSQKTRKLRKIGIFIKDLKQTQRLKNQKLKTKFEKMGDNEGGGASEKKN